MALSAITVETKENLTKNKISKLESQINILSELTKFRITFFVAVTTIVGYLLYSGKFNIEMLLPTIGVLILACGASALNEYQEREIDAKMVRTNSRPIPSGRISEQDAIKISVFLIVLGGALLVLHSIDVFLLGIFTLIWYNFVYTPLKRQNSLAIVPGSLVGALPPIIGWVAAGGDILDPRVLSFAIFMFIWQIPHFGLLLLMYDKEYKKAGFPTLSNILSVKQIITITYLFVVLLTLSSSLFYLFGTTYYLTTNLLLVITGLLTLVITLKIILELNSDKYKKAFLAINSYVLLVLIILSVESIV